MFWEYMRSRINAFPNSILQDETQRFTYKEFYLQVRQLAAGLAVKLEQGSYVGITCTSQLNTALCLAACWEAGVTPTPLPDTYGRVYLENTVKALQPDAIVTDNIVSRMADVPVLPMDRLREHKRKNTAYAVGGPQEVTAILCTSGTTGVPKGVMLTNAGLLYSVQDIEGYFAISEKDTMLITRPLSHCAAFTGELLAGMAKGASIRFAGINNPRAVLGFLHGVTVVGGSPSLFYHMAQLTLAHDKQIKTIRAIAISGERLVETAGQTIRKAFPHTQIFNVYGLVEASPRVSHLPPELFDSHVESIGIPLHAAQVRIADEYGLECGPNQLGELCVKGPSIMLGYYKDAKLTRQKIQNGWLHTGDIAYKDKDGLLYIKGRADNMITRGGLNIYPEEIEALLLRHEAVKDVMAYPIPLECGEEIGLKIVPADDYASFTTEYATRICMQLLPRHLWPNSIEAVATLPGHVFGKKTRTWAKARNA